jgi:hypothetical protein
MIDEEVRFRKKAAKSFEGAVPVVYRRENLK